MVSGVCVAYSITLEAYRRRESCSWRCDEKKLFFCRTGEAVTFFPEFHKIKEFPHATAAAAPLQLGITSTCQKDPFSLFSIFMFHNTRHHHHKTYCQPEN